MVLQKKAAEQVVVLGKCSPFTWSRAESSLRIWVLIRCCLVVLLCCLVMSVIMVGGHMLKNIVTTADSPVRCTAAAASC